MASLPSPAHPLYRKPASAMVSGAPSRQKCGIHHFREEQHMIAAGRFGHDAAFDGRQRVLAQQGGARAAGGGGVPRQFVADFRVRPPEGPGEFTPSHLAAHGRRRLPRLAARLRSARPAPRRWPASVAQMSSAPTSWR